MKTQVSKSSTDLQLSVGCHKDSMYPFNLSSAHDFLGIQNKITGSVKCYSVALDARLLKIDLGGDLVSVESLSSRAEFP